MPLADPLIIQAEQRLKTLYQLCLLDTPADPAFDRLTRLASRILKTPVSLVTLVDADRQFLKSFVGVGEPWASQRQTPLSYSFCQHAVATQKPLIIEDARLHPLVYDNFAIQELDVIAYAGIPLVTSDGQAVGAFCAIDSQPRHWTEEELFILSELAASVMTEIELRSELLERQRVEKALREYNESLTALRKIEAELAEQLDVQSILSIGIDASIRASHARNGFIALLEGEYLLVAGAFGRYQVGQRYPVTMGIMGRILQTGQAELVSNVQHDPDYVAEIPETRAQMTFPIAYRQRVLGLLNLETDQADDFTEADFRFLALMSARIGTALENAGLYSQVRDLEQLKTDMIRLAAHDLRNPLTNLSGYAQLLLDTPLNDEQAEYLGSIQHCVTRMEAIISGVLSLQRLETRDIQREQCSLKQLAQDAYEAFLFNAAQKRLDYQVSLPEADILTQGDALQLGEAMSNLISNAVKYTPEGGRVFVSLSEERGSDGRRVVVFEVADTGYGIPAGLQANLFKPFTRIRTEETVGIDGSGLGLHLVKNIIERHKGQLRVRSTYQHGSTFGFELPLRKHG